MPQLSSYINGIVFGASRPSCHSHRICRLGDTVGRPGGLIITSNATINNVILEVEFHHGELVNCGIT